MPKDNEKMPLFDVGPLTPTEPQAFTPEQMVQCEKCKRSNPPTRVTCLYCGHPFAFDDKIANLQKPTLRPLERWEQGYNNIFLPAQLNQSPGKIDEVATLLKLNQQDVRRILESGSPLPLARAASHDEALLIERRLKDFGLRTLILSDADLGIEELPPVRIRAGELTEDGMWAHQSGGGDSIHLAWNDLRLVVLGRLTVKMLEVQEHPVAGKENQILDARETFSDELVVDLYSSAIESNLRISANSFDFTCLGNRKGLLAIENFKSMLQLFTELAPDAIVDDSFKGLRQTLEPVWSAEKQTGSQGWRRTRPGKYVMGALTEVSNESQFTRYSRLRNHVLHHPHLYEAK
ncbi:MAG TPA: hypothetical protein VIB00_10435 [Pyrinomonadaceae bacterium]